jgi:hypothetical protein
MSRHADAALSIRALSTFGDAPVMGQWESPALPQPE